MIVASSVRACAIDARHTDRDADADLSTPFRDLFTGYSPPLQDASPRAATACAELFVFRGETQWVWISRRTVVLRARARCRTPATSGATFGLVRRMRVR
jgi:hypothetical protein